MPYVRSKEFETTFDGKRVTAKLSPLKVPDAIELAGIMPAKGEPFESVKAKAGQMLCVFQRIIPNYASDLQGVSAHDGSAVKIAEVCDSAYFLELVREMGRTLMTEANGANPQQPSELSSVPSEGDSESSEIQSASAA